MADGGWHLAVGGWLATLEPVESFPRYYIPSPTANRQLALLMR
jgi:hypothetical protein